MSPSCERKLRPETESDNLTGTVTNRPTTRFPRGERFVGERFDEVEVGQIDALAGVQPELPYQPLLADFEKFPVDCFPIAVRDYVIQQAANLDCDRATVAIPVLSVLASSIGGPRRIRLKRSWTEPSVLWTAVVANGEACASPPIDAAVEPVEDRGQGSGVRKQ